MNVEVTVTVIVVVQVQLHTTITGGVVVTVTRDILKRKYNRVIPST